MTRGQHDEVGRIHRLIAAHIAHGFEAEHEPYRQAIARLLTRRASDIYDDPAPPAAWELDALVGAVPPLLRPRPESRDLAHEAMFLSGKLMAYRGLGAARAMLDATHPVFQALAAERPGDLERQRDLSVSHSLVGDVLRAQGDMAGALREYRATHAILERLASADPSNATWQRDLVVSHYKLAGIHRRAGNAAEERASLLRCREVLRGMRAAGM